MKATVCSTLESLDVTDNYNKAKEHEWPGLDDSIEVKFSAAIMGYINIGAAGEYNFTLTADDAARIFFDTSITPLISFDGASSTLRSIRNTITLSPGRHLMRLYYLNNGGRATLKLTYASSVAGLPETVVDKVVTFVGGQAPSFLRPSDVTTIISGRVKTDRPRMAGSHVTSFSVNPALPSGLQLNSVTGVISGTCSSSTSGDYSMTATGPLGSTTSVVHIVVGGAPLSGLSAKYYKLLDPNMACYMTEFGDSDISLLVDTVDASINHPEMRAGSAWSGIPGDVFENFYVVWSGFIQISEVGDYTFSLNSREGSRLFLNHNMVINKWDCQWRMTNKNEVVSFDSTGYVPIEVQFFSPNDFGAILSWKKPSSESLEPIPASAFAHIPEATFSYTTSKTHYYRNVEIPVNNPVFFGMSVSAPTFEITPALPSGLTMHSSGAIMGTPAVDAEEITYTIKATAQSTVYTTTVCFQVTYVAPPTNLQMKKASGEEVSSLTLTQFTAMEPIYLTADNDPRTWTVEPELPSGLSLSTRNVTITGMPLVSSEQKAYTIRASNSGGSVSKTLLLSVSGCQYGKWFYSVVQSLNPISFTLKKSNGEVVYQNNNVQTGDYGMAFCIPQGDYVYTIQTQSAWTSFVLKREDGIVFLDQTIKNQDPVSGEFSNIVKEKPVLSIQQPPEFLAAKQYLELPFNVTGIYKPLYAEPPFSRAFSVSPMGNILACKFTEKGTYTYKVIAENEKGKSEVTLVFNVGTCPDGKVLITFSRSYGYDEESMVITSESGEEILKTSFRYDKFSRTMCVANGDYKVVMRTTREGGSWTVGQELLVKDSWDDLLASTLLDNGKGEKTEYFTINYAILDRLEMRFYNDAKAPSSKWKSVDFNDKNWSLGDYATFGNFTANTAYFRREFTVDNKNKYPIFAFDLEIYDGAIAYINGKEVMRRNMALGDVDHSSFSASRYNGLFWRRTSVPTSALQNGKNVLVVELHRTEGFHTGITFDMYASLLSGECMKRTDRGTGSDSEHTPSAKYAPANAFDDGRLTMWRDSNLPVYLQFTYNYDRFEYINKVVLMAGDNYKKNCPKKFDILGMTSESEGDVLASVDDRNLFGESFATTSVFMKNAKSYNAYRMRVDETNDNSNVASVSEMILYTCNIVYCPKEKGWDSIMSGSSSYGACPRRTFGESYRSCGLNKYDPEWSAIDYSNCLSTNPPSGKAYIDFKYMVSNCTRGNFDRFVESRFIDITRDILLAKKENIKLYLVRDCSDSETFNVCFYVRVTTDLDIADYVFRNMNELQETMSYRMYSNPSIGFPEGMYFVMVTSPLLRTPAAKTMIVVVAILVVVIVVVTGVLVYNIRSDNSVKKVRGGTVHRKSTIVSMQEKAEQEKKEKTGLLGQN